MNGNAILTAITPTVMGYLKWGGIIFLGFVILLAGIFIILEMKRKKWKVEIHEQKADGKLHTVDYDTLVERKLKMGTKTIYWLKKYKQEVIPPPYHVVDRYKGKDEVDYLRVERDFVPVEKTLKVNYNVPKTNFIVQGVYDKILQKVRDTKTTFFDSSPVRERFMYIPMERALVAKMEFKPIDYDMHMMAVNQISNADEFYQSKYEFWKKYGAVIVFAVTIVFLIILIVLTFGYIKDIVAMVMGEVQKNTNVLTTIAEKMGVASAKPPA